jgi:copper(I)-binding protein
MENSDTVFIIRRFLLLIVARLILAGVLVMPASAMAEVLVQKAWVRSTPGANRNSAAYAIIINTGPKADRLMMLSSPDADKTDLHESKNTDGIMSMEAIVSLTIPARSQVVLKPGSYHAMISGLSRPLRGGETLPMTFSFEFYGDVDVEAMVAPFSSTTYPGPKPKP